MRFHQLCCYFMASCSSTFILKAACICSNSCINTSGTMVTHLNFHCICKLINKLTGCGSTCIKQSFLRISYIRNMVVDTKLNLVSIGFPEISHKLRISYINGNDGFWFKFLAAADRCHKIISFREFITAKNSAAFSQSFKQIL